MPYGLIRIGAVVVLVFRYLTSPSPSDRSKLVVGLIGVASVLAYWGFPRWRLAATLLQVAVSIYVLISLKVTPAAN